MRRAGPATGRNRRSVIVAWLRVLLPLAALAILSTLFLLSRRPDPDASIPYARVEAEARARDPRITAPSYAGVTSDGAVIALTADRATPGRDGGVSGADGLRLDWKSPDGLAVTLSAPRADIQPSAIRLEGGVRLTTSTGWQVQTPRMEAATDRSRIVAEGGVQASAPFGTVSAGAVELRRSEGGGGDGAGGRAAADGVPDHNLLDFTGGVRLIYRP